MESYAQFRAQRPAVKAAFSESILADWGLIDVDAVSKEMNRFSASGSTHEGLSTLFEAERWLQSFVADQPRR